MSDTQEVLFAAAYTATALAALEKALSREGQTLLDQAHSLDADDPLVARATDFMRGYQAAYQAFQHYAGLMIEQMTEFTNGLGEDAGYQPGGYL
jgi:hypothetical protein